MAQPNLSGAEIGRLNAERFRAYIQALREDEKPIPSRAGKPNLSAMALACGFDRQVFYNNPECKELLSQAVAELGLQPSSTTPGKAYSETAVLEARILKLEQKNAALKAEVDEMRKRLRLYRHIEEHLIETGRRIIP